MKSKFIRNLILLFVFAWGYAHIPEIATEATKLGTAYASEAMIGTPALEVPEWFFDFGEVTEGTDYLHSFIIRNKGTATLEIRKVQPG
jgi:hypothetical protein